MNPREYLRQTYHAHKRSFSRASLTAMLATVVDFSTLVSLVEVFHVYYVIGTATGAFCGAITNFLTNKYWAFEAKHGKIHVQGFRYALVSGVSLCLNTGLVFFITETFHLKYVLSKTIAAVAVAWCWNYPMHRHFVFRRAH